MSNKISKYKTCRDCTSFLDVEINPDETVSVICPYDKKGRPTPSKCEYTELEILE